MTGQHSSKAASTKPACLFAWPYHIVSFNLCSLERLDERHQLSIRFPAPAQHLFQFQLLPLYPCDDLLKFGLRHSWCWHLHGLHP